jgi:hypothetical protein
MAKAIAHPALGPNGWAQLGYRRRRVGWLSKPGPLSEPGVVSISAVVTGTVDRRALTKSPQGLRMGESIRRAWVPAFVNSATTLASVTATSTYSRSFKASRVEKSKGWILHGAASLKVARSWISRISNKGSAHRFQWWLFVIMTII